MFMAFVYWQLSVKWHVPPFVALAIVVLVLAPAFGALIERVLIRRVAGAPVFITLTVTIGLLVLLIAVVNQIWKTAGNVPPFFGNHGFELFGVFVIWQDVITIGAAIAIAVGLRLFLYRTRPGIAMRGVVDNRGLIGLYGGRPSSYSTLSWAIGASLASVAGILVAPTLQLQPLILTLLVVDAYAAAIVGRLKSLPLTFVGALGVGLLSSYAIGYMPSTGFWSASALQGLKLSIPSILLFLVLLALPMSSLRTGALQRRIGLLPASFTRSVQGGVALVVAVVIVVQFLGAGDVVYLGVGLATALVCLSLVPLTGWAGQVSLCQMTFAGLGAFAMWKFGSGGSVLGLLAAAGLAGAVGAVIALPALRLQGLYLALATLAFALAMDNMFFPATFGFNGAVHVDRPSLFGLHATTDKSMVILLAVVFAVVSIGLLALRRGPFGRVLIAIKDSEAACSTLGLNLTLTKVAVFALSAALAGLAGAFLGGMQTVVSGTDFQTLQSLPILLLVVIGGVTTCSGALFGATYGFFPAISNAFPALASVQLLLPGLAGVTLGSNPEGVLPSLYVRVNAFRRRASAGLDRGAARDGTDSPGLLVGGHTP
jgi:branched-chain amino acid transport system permease protein